MLRIAMFGAVVLWACLTSALSNVADIAIRPKLPMPVAAAVQARYPGAIIVRADLEKQANGAYRLKIRSPEGHCRPASLDVSITPEGQFIRTERSVGRRESKTAMLARTMLRIE